MSLYYDMAKFSLIYRKRELELNWNKGIKHKICIS